jgi:DNA-binding GntR family transcriptional regulator
LANKLRRTTLKDQAYRALRDMIASHRFTSGTWINAEQLAKELGVSRTPVWQALKELEKQGLVRHEPNRGIRMVEMTPDMAVELYEVRGVLEGMAASLAARCIPARSIKRLEAILDRQHELVQRQDSVAYSRSDFEFHAELYNSCRNWLLKELLDKIKSKAQPFVRDITPILGELYRDHRGLVQALKQGDAQAARQTMLRHNRRVRRLVEQDRRAGAAT